MPFPRPSETTTMCCFPLPESYTSYVADVAVRTAVDHILANQLVEIPEALVWNQLPDFHAAVLAAHQVRCDYPSTLQGLWDAVWQRAIDKAPIVQELEPWSIADTANWYQVRFDAMSLWQNGVFARAYTRQDSYIGLGVSLGIRDARLTFWFGDEDDQDLASDLLPQDDWNPEPEDYGYCSKAGLAPIREDSEPPKRCVPLTGLNAAAARALAAIAG